MDVIKILLVEDEQEECDNFAHCIDLCERMELMATTDSARHAMELTRERARSRRGHPRSGAKRR